MSGLNRVQLIGHLGADPESRTLPSSGDLVTNLRLATSEQWKDKQSGERRERTEWHTVVFFGRIAEVASEYLRKGSQVYIEGKLRTEKWQDKQGNDRWTTKVMGDSMVLLGKPKGDGERDNNQSTGDRRAGEGTRVAGGGYGDTPATRTEHDFDDDIPF